MRNLHIVLLGLGLVLSGATPSSAADTEPVYKGKPLHEWVFMLKFGQNLHAPLNAAPDKDVRLTAAIALAKIGKDAVPPLIDALKNFDREVQKSAMFALMEIGEPAVVPLVEALKDSNRIERIVEGRGNDPLVDPTALKSNAIFVLIKMGEPAVAPLIDALKDYRQGMVHDAEFVLGQIGEPAVTPLINALKDENVQVRLSCLFLLTSKGPKAKAAVPIVIPMLKDGNKDIRFRAAFFLKEVDPEAAEKAGVP